MITQSKVTEDESAGSDNLQNTHNQDVSVGHVVSDSDYPPVYGYGNLPADFLDLAGSGLSGSSLANKTLTKKETAKKPVQKEVEPAAEVSSERTSALKASPSPTLVNNQDVCDILNRDGYNTSLDQIKALNVFLSPIESFQYALYSFGKEDFFIVLMINKRRKTIYGHHVLDLTQAYSLAEDLVNRMKTKSIVV